MTERKISQRQLRAILNAIEVRELEAATLFGLIEDDFRNVSDILGGELRQCLESMCVALERCRCAFEVSDFPTCSRSLVEVDEQVNRSVLLQRDVLFMLKERAADQPRSAAKHSRPNAINPTRARMRKLMAAERARGKQFKEFVRDFTACPEDGMSIVMLEPGKQDPQDQRTTFVVRDDNDIAKEGAEVDAEGRVLWRIAYGSLKTMYSASGRRKG